MSVVTNVMMLIGYKDANLREDFGRESAFDHLNRWIEEEGYKPLVALDDKALPARWYGGNRAFEADVYIGAFNFLDLDEFFEKIVRLEWISPDWLQLFVLEQEDVLFKSYLFSDLVKLVEERTRD